MFCKPYSFQKHNIYSVRNMPLDKLISIKRFFTSRSLTCTKFRSAVALNTLISAISYPKAHAFSSTCFLLSALSASTNSLKDKDL